MSDAAQRRTLVVLVENKAGVLARVSSLFARRNYNITSLAVAPTDDERFSRITIVVNVRDTPIDQITKQLFKLINVVQIDALEPGESIEREMLMATVTADSVGRGQIVELANIFGGDVLNVGATELMVGLAGVPSKLDDFEDLLRPYGIVALQRTGRVALPKVSRTDTSRLEAVS